MKNERLKLFSLEACLWPSCFTEYPQWLMMQSVEDCLSSDNLQTWWLVPNLSAEAVYLQEPAPNSSTSRLLNQIGAHVLTSLHQSVIQSFRMNSIVHKIRRCSLTSFDECFKRYLREPYDIN
mmetsp:Transcript_27946/g.109662  ORF Transcript_27946/g.109662 Transcript_27946/m.109662 type:complete len:122 (-) Transcript_27946:1211-1576(-)